MKILIVDDEPMVARAVRRLLHGHNVDMVHNAADAFEAAQQTAYDVVISDIDIPDKPGPEICVGILRLQTGPKPCVIFHTGRTYWSPPPELAGAPVLFKPCSKADLLATIARCTLKA